MPRVMSRGIVLTAAGVGIGAVLAWFVTRAMNTLLYGITATDPLTFALVAALLTAVSAVGLRDSAMRAARVDPTLVLCDPIALHSSLKFLYITSLLTHREL